MALKAKKIITADSPNQVSATVLSHCKQTIGFSGTNFKATTYLIICAGIQPPVNVGIYYDKLGKSGRCGRWLGDYAASGMHIDAKRQSLISAENFTCC